MSSFILGIVVVLVLGALVIIWIAYCMFIRERPKSEFFHQNIPDRNVIPDQNEVSPKKEMAVEQTGCRCIPEARHKQKNEKKKEEKKSPPLLVALEQIVQSQKK